MSVERARQLRKSMTRYEVKLWLHLRELVALGFRFRRQVPLGAVIADFACFNSRLVIEVDGNQHGLPEYHAADEKRDTVLTAKGYLVMRFTNNDVWESIESVVETILNKGQPRLQLQP
jgi:very-short-patch-repair endonuclease